MFGGVEDGKGHAHEGEDNQTATEVHPTQDSFCHPYSDFHFLLDLSETDDWVMRGLRELTKSFACSFSVDSSCFSRTCSSLKVVLRGLSNRRPGVPGTLIALFNGEPGVSGTSTCRDGSF